MVDKQKPDQQAPVVNLENAQGKTTQPKASTKITTTPNPDAPETSVFVAETIDRNKPMSPAIRRALDMFDGKGPRGKKDGEITQAEFKAGSEEYARRPKESTGMASRKGQAGPSPEAILGQAVLDSPTGTPGAGKMGYPVILNDFGDSKIDALEAAAVAEAKRNPTKKSAGDVGGMTPPTITEPSGAPVTGKAR